MELKQVVVDGLMTRYGSSGHGKTLLMLHGWGDSLATFDGLSEALAAEYQVIAVDLPGFGQTQAPPTAWGVDDYAEFVKLFLEKVNLSPYAVIGHSNGGAIAIRLLAKQSADKLILLASAGIRNRQKLKKQILKVGAKGAKIVTVVLPKATRERLRNKLYGAIGSDFLTVPHMQETFKRVVAEDVTESARSLHAPALLIYGSHDESTPVFMGEALKAAIPNSRLVIVGGAGHFVHHDSAKEVLKLIEEFLR